ncbi:MAG: response regulator [Dehalococcoidia bacterium]
MQKFFLVIDSNEEDGSKTVKQLTAVIPGAEATWAPSAEAALALLESQRLVPSLIFAALELPGMTGLELLGEIRTRRWLERAPVAILSELASDRQVIASYRLGACAFLAKPVRPHELREAVRDFGVPAVRLSTGGVVEAGKTGLAASAA